MSQNSLNEAISEVRLEQCNPQAENRMFKTCHDHRAFSVFDSVYMEQMMVAFGQWTWVHLMWAHNAIGHVTRVGSS